MSDCNCNRSFSTGKKGCYYDSCYEEYGNTMSACIKNKTPDCTAKAVIPSITTKTIDGLTNVSNCFVHVTDINTTFYVDDKHRPMITWAGNVEVDLPGNIETQEEFDEFIKSFKLRSQFLYVKFKTNETPVKWIIDSFYFDKTGKQYFVGKFEEITEE